MDLIFIGIFMALSVVALNWVMLKMVGIDKSDNALTNHLQDSYWRHVSGEEGRDNDRR